MEVYVTMRVDFINQPKKSNALESKVDIGKTLKPDSYKNLNQKSIRLDWECLSVDWDEVIPKAIDKLIERGSEAVFAVIAGDDGWYEVWTHVKGTLRVYHEWGTLDLEDQLDDMDDFLSFINSVRKEEIKKHKDTPYKKKYKAKPIKINAAIDPRRLAAEHWEPNDENWLVQRKLQWTKIEKYLSENVPERITHEDFVGFYADKNFLSFHKELFFYGTNSGYPMIVDGRLNPSLRQSEMNTYQSVYKKQYAENAWLAFLIWYHPKPETIDLDGLLEDYVTIETVLPRDYIFSQMPVFSKEGVFFGREQYLVKAFFPKHEIKYKLNVKWMTEQIDIDIGIGGTGRKFKYGLTKICLLDSLRELSSENDFVPNAIGQYLWGHLSYLLEHNPDCVFVTLEEKLEIKEEVALLENTQKLDFFEKLEFVGKKLSNRTVDTLKPIEEMQQNRELMENVLKQIIDFDQRSEEVRNRPTTKAFVESMMKRYTDRAFSQPLLAIWDDIIKSKPR